MKPALAAAERTAERAAAEQTFVRLPRGDLLLGYQRRTVDLLFAGTALVVIEKSRRIGLTWAVAAFAALKASAAAEAGGQNIWYIGYEKEMTLEFIEVCAMWCRAFALISGDIEEEEVLDEESGQPVKMFSIRLASGFRITALASVPRKLRGKQGIVIVDEASYHKDVAAVLKAAMALLIWGGQVIVIATHDGVSNGFNLLLGQIRSGERKGVPVRITFQDAIADGLYERAVLVARTRGVEIEPKDQWIDDIYGYYGEDASEELDCVPKIGSGSLLSIEDIAACEHEDCGIAELYQGGICYIGRDVARRRDGQIQYCMEMIGDVLWQRDTYEEVGQSFAHQDAFFNGLFKTRRISSAWIDQTGMGEKVVEDLQRLHGARVHGELLTGPSRLDIALSLKKRFEEHRIRIRFDPVTRADLLAIKKVGSEESGGVRIVNDGQVHADRFWAYGLASRAADLPPAMYAYAGVPKGWRGDPRRAGFDGRRADDRPDRHGRGSRFTKGCF